MSDNPHQKVIAEIGYDLEAVKNSINRARPLLLDQKSHPMEKQLLEMVGEVKKRLANTVMEEAQFDNGRKLQPNSETNRSITYDLIRYAIRNPHRVRQWLILGRRLYDQIA